MELGSNYWSRYGRHVYFLKKIRTAMIVFFSVLVIVTAIFIILNIRNNMKNDRQELLQIWNGGDYIQAYEFSKTALLEKPVDYFLLTINGFSAYQMGISQINNQNMLAFINECIFSLRKALLHKESSGDGRIFYVLGKAYGYKGGEYADLAVKYLEIANDLSYPASDIPEYLGLAYAAFGDYRSSVEAFSLAFIPGKSPSDNLLLSIARSYIAMEEYNTAFGYLQRCIDISPDSKSVVISRMLLAEIYGKNGEYDNAETQYLNILSDSGENAEVRFQLGEIYNLKGDTTRARAEWRLAYRQDPAHARARARLNI
jgi:tetratricopeptide (TPR) repeat protein